MYAEVIILTGDGGTEVLWLTEMLCQEVDTLSVDHRATVSLA
jgi:hypothetical protein